MFLFPSLAMTSEIKEEAPVHEEFTLCCGVETQVLKCGPWTDLFNDQSASRPKLLIFIIPGKLKDLDEETVSTLLLLISERIRDI